MFQKMEASGDTSFKEDVFLIFSKFFPQFCGRLYPVYSNIPCAAAEEAPAQLCPRWPITVAPSCVGRTRNWQEEEEFPQGGGGG